MVLLSNLYNPEVELNQFGCNAQIFAKILSDKEMTNAKFEDKGEYWSYFKFLTDSISFCVQIYKDNPTKRIRIDILHEDFLQPYDFQYILNKNPQHKFANKISRLVETEMSRLNSRGIIFGHNYGEYI